MKLWSADIQTDVSSFMDDNYLLRNKMAEILYHEFARDLPIIDYHCHLPPDDIASDRNFTNITEVWLDGDHYKWRAMRTLGISEEFITGDTHPLIGLLSGLILFHSPFVTRSTNGHTSNFDAIST